MVSIKRRRLILKKERSSKNTSITNREGISYESGSGYLNTSDLLNETMIAGILHINLIYLLNAFIFIHFYRNYFIFVFRKC